MMKTRAAVFRKPSSPLTVETLDLEEPLAGEVLVKLRAVGVCHSDWHLVSGATLHPAPAVVGHEGAGVVTAVGPKVDRVKLGDHISLNWAPSCGECFYCKNDRPSLCSKFLGPIWAGTMMDGTTRLSKDGERVYHFSALACFSEFAVVPQECCVPLDADVPWNVAALIGCAVTTGVGAVLNTAQVRKGTTVVVVGAGGVGLSIIMGAHYAGARNVIAIDLIEAKRSVAISCGATHFISVDAEVSDQVRALTEGRGADYVFEAAGVPSIQEKCLDLARPGGTVILAGITPVGSTTNLPGAIITRKELTIKGSYYGTADTARDFPLYAELFLQGKLPIDRLVSKEYSLEQINEAYADMLSGTVARGIVVFN